MIHKIKIYIENRTAFRCKTEDQLTMFSIYLDNLGYTWCNGRTYADEVHTDYKEETCYYPFDGTYCDYGYFVENGYNVIDFEDIDTRFKDNKFIPDFKIKKIIDLKS